MPEPLEQMLDMHLCRIAPGVSAAHKKPGQQRDPCFSNMVCYYCKKRGHGVRYCRKFWTDHPVGDDWPPKLTAAVSTLASERRPGWVQQFARKVTHTTREHWPTGPPMPGCWPSASYGHTGNRYPAGDGTYVPPAGYPAMAPMGILAPGQAPNGPPMVQAISGPPAIKQPPSAGSKSGAQGNE